MVFLKILESSYKELIKDPPMILYQSYTISNKTILQERVQVLVKILSKFFFKIFTVYAEDTNQFLQRSW